MDAVWTPMSRHASKTRSGGAAMHVVSSKRDTAPAYVAALRRDQLPEPTAELTAFIRAYESATSTRETTESPY